MTKVQSEALRTMIARRGAELITGWVAGSGLSGILVTVAVRDAWGITIDAAAPVHSEAMDASLNELMAKLDKVIEEHVLTMPGINIMETMKG